MSDLPLDPVPFPHQLLAGPVGRHRADDPPVSLESDIGRSGPSAGWALAAPSRSERLQAATARAVAAIGDRFPERLRAARLRPTRRAVGGLLVLAVAVAAILGARWAMAVAAARPVPVSAVQPIASSSGPSGAGPTGTGVTGTGAPSPGSTGTGTSIGTGTSTASPSSTAGPSLVVQVAGRVHHPRVVHLPAGSRVQDALKAAGGALPGSDLVGINLAQLLTDGVQVVVARAGRGSSVNVSGVSQSGTGSPGVGTPPGAAGSASVDLNTADLVALDALPGVGPVLAQRILDWRTAHGRFTSLDELDEVSGIGDKLLAEIRPHARL